MREWSGERKRGSWEPPFPSDGTSCVPDCPLLFRPVVGNGSEGTSDDTETIAAHCVSCPPWGSRTNRTARSRSSGEYLFECFIAPVSQGLEPPGNPVRFTSQNRLQVKMFAKYRHRDTSSQDSKTSTTRRAGTVAQGPRPTRKAATPRVLRCPHGLPAGPAVLDGAAHRMVRAAGLRLRRRMRVGTRKLGRSGPPPRRARPAQRLPDVKASRSRRNLPPRRVPRPRQSPRFHSRRAADPARSGPLSARPRVRSPLCGTANPS